MGYTKVEAIALVTNLRGTGSDPAPNDRREALREEMKTNGVKDPDGVLALDSTAMTFVKAYFPPGVRKGDRVDLIVESPPRCQLQDWGLSNGCENLNRLGGEPTWIQNPEYPRCPGCADTMRFVLQLDSLHFTTGLTWEWGSDGIVYVFWCTACSMSATLWQST